MPSDESRGRPDWPNPGLVEGAANSVENSRARACKISTVTKMPNRVTFNPKALFATVAFVTVLGLASYAETRKWAVATPIGWILHGLISGHFRTRSDEARTD